MKGKKTGGRARGTPNKITAEAKETFRLVFDALAPELEEWIRSAARRSPAKGAELLLRLAEHFIPRLARNDVATNSGGPLVVVVKQSSTNGYPEAQLEAVGMSDRSRPDVRTIEASRSEQ